MTIPCFFKIPSIESKLYYLIFTSCYKVIISSVFGFTKPSEIKFKINLEFRQTAKQGHWMAFGIFRGFFETYLFLCICNPYGKT